MSEQAKAMNDCVERRVIDASKNARLTAGWKSRGWARRVEGDFAGSGVEVGIELATASKFGDRVSVVLRMDADQVAELARVSGATAELIAEWLNRNGSTVRATSERDEENLRLTQVAAKLRRKLARVEAALREDA